MGDADGAGEVGQPHGAESLNLSEQLGAWCGYSVLAEAFIEGPDHRFTGAAEGVGQFSGQVIGQLSGVCGHGGSRLHVDSSISRDLIF